MFYNLMYFPLFLVAVGAVIGEHGKHDASGGNINDNVPFTKRFDASDDCNPVVCASPVSFCFLDSYCRCDNPRVNRTCTEQCLKCLGEHAQDCCLCLDMCERSEDTVPYLKSKSNIEYLPEPQEELFSVLTQEPDPMERWTIESMLAGGEVGNQSKVEDSMYANCTLVFLAQCMSLEKCKTHTCTSMGATAYRWFEDGCCECIGQQCPQFGLAESKCSQCPLYVDNEDDEEEVVNRVQRDKEGQDKVLPKTKRAEESGLEESGRV